METVNNNNKKILVAALVLITGFGFVGCGPQKVQSGAAPVGSQTVDPSGKPLATCSHDVANISDLSVRSQTYQVGGIENSNWIRVKFDRFPSTFTDQNAAIIMWTKTMDISGNSLTPVQAPFFLEVPNGVGQFKQISQEMTSLSWSQLSAYATQNGISTSSAQTTLASITFVVKLDGAALSANILTATLYLSSSNTPSRWVESLIPKFYANPVDYNVSHATYMQNLHPLKYMLGGSWTTAQYLSEDQRFCF